MSTGAATARRLLERTGGPPIISLYFDLDPSEFATAPARAAQARALMDEARRVAADEHAMGHEERSALSGALARIDAYLASDDLPVSDARALAIFCSGEDGLFETVALSQPVTSRVFVDRVAHVEPLATASQDEQWCAVLVSSRAGDIYVGHGREITEHQSIEDYVRGRGNRGATARNTEEQDIEGHLIQLAEAIYRDWQRDGFTTLALSGPAESASRLEELLHNDLRPVLLDSHLNLDASSATASDVRDAVAEALAGKFAAHRSHTLQEMTARANAGDRAAAGVDAVLEALNEQRAETLLLSRDFAATGGRCPSCGMLVAEGVDPCPADGTTIEPVPDLREAVVQAALLQDAAVIAFDQPQDELPPAHPVAALLRF
jgi:peptide chain release factor subunit 1